MLARVPSGYRPRHRPPPLSRFQPLFLRDTRYQGRAGTNFLFSFWGGYRLGTDLGTAPRPLFLGGTRFQGRVGTEWVPSIFGAPALCFWGVLDSLSRGYRVGVPLPGLCFWGVFDYKVAWVPRFPSVSGVGTEWVPPPGLCFWGVLDLKVAWVPSGYLSWAPPPGLFYSISASVSGGSPISKVAWVPNFSFLSWVGTDWVPTWVPPPGFCFWGVLDFKGRVGTEWVPTFLPPPPSVSGRYPISRRLEYIIYIGVWGGVRERYPPRVPTGGQKGCPRTRTCKRTHTLYHDFFPNGVRASLRCPPHSFPCMVFFSVRLHTPVFFSHAALTSGCAPHSASPPPHSAPACSFRAPQVLLRPSLINFENIFWSESKRLPSVRAERKSRGSSRKNIQKPKRKHRAPPAPV